jgi:putative flippase GtrA
VKAAPGSIPAVITRGARSAREAQLAYPRSRSLAPLLGAYLRSQLVALLATAVDFAVMVVLVEGVAGVEALHVHYLAATALGAITGGVTAFLGNRQYSFLAEHGRLGPQSLRYALVWIGSITLNVVLVYALTDGAALPYTWSKVLTAVLVGAGFNFPLHRWYVFR